MTRVMSLIDSPLAVAIAPSVKSWFLAVFDWLTQNWSIFDRVAVLSYHFDRVFSYSIRYNVLGSCPLQFYDGHIRCIDTLTRIFIHTPTISLFIHVRQNDTNFTPICTVKMISTLYKCSPYGLVIDISTFLAHIHVFSSLPQPFRHLYTYGQNNNNFTPILYDGNAIKYTPVFFHMLFHITSISALSEYQYSIWNSIFSRTLSRLRNT